MNLRFIVFVPAALVATANQNAHTLGIDPEGKLNTFSRQLVGAGDAADATPTYWAAMGRLSPASLAFLAAHQANFLPGAMWWALGDDNDDQYGICQKASNAATNGQALDFDGCLALAGLKRRAISAT